MSLPAGCAPRFSGWSLAAGLLVAVTAGCNKNVSPNEARDKQFAENSGYKKVNVAKFSGKVTVDGQPPTKDAKLFVILNDFSHLDENAKRTAPRLYTACDPEGNFGFTTNELHDGVATGKYVVTFVELPIPQSGGAAADGHFKVPKGLGGGAAKKYHGPDELKNLYNDPDKNVKEDKYVLDLKPPGKDDYQFELSVAGKDVVPLGPNAVKEIKTVR
jgi:hypothetical protein